MEHRIIDLSHSIEHGMVTYPGLPGPDIGDHLSREASRARYAPGTEFHIGRVTLVGNTGTYIDTPNHRFADGPDLVTTPLERMVDLEGVVVEAMGLPFVDADLFDGYELLGRAVLIHTGWSSHWGTDAYLAGHPFLTAAAANRLVREGATLVGIDSLNVDGTSGGERPVHSTLLAAGIPIVEHLCHLDQVPGTGFRFSAAPPAIAGLSSFPVRAHAIVEELQDHLRAGS